MILSLTKNLIFTSLKMFLISFRCGLYESSWLGQLRTLSSYKNRNRNQPIKIFINFFLLWFECFIGRGLVFSYNYEMNITTISNKRYATKEINTKQPKQMVELKLK